MEAPVKVGEVLAGKYKVESILGAGAMGVVVAARHLDLQQMVALKFMLPSALPDQAAGDRFLREAQAAGRLRGEHVARVMDFGRLEGGAPYIVMEFLEGENLEQVLDREGPLPVATAAMYISQACSGMAEAHAQGIVHRDLKPQNLFLTKRPDGSPLVKVLDFGISKLQGDGAGSATATQSMAVMGSPAYMSPEQARSAKRVDARGDIYALGAILYQLVSGFLPFMAESVAGMLVAIVSEPPTPLRDVAPGVSPDFAALVLQCLEKDRDKRPQTARELAIGLAPFMTERPSLWEAETERVTGQNLAAQHTKATVKGEGIVTTMEPSSRPAGPKAIAADALKVVTTADEKKKKSGIVLFASVFSVTLVLGIGVLALVMSSRPKTADPVASATAETTTTAPAASPPTSAMMIAPAATPSTAATTPPPAGSSATTTNTAASATAAAMTAAKNSPHASHADAGAPHAAASAAPSAAPSSKPAAGLFDRPE